MVDCQYCDRQFDDEGALLEHLVDAHGDDLGPIDRRRIQGASASGTGRSNRPLLAIGVAAVALLGVLLLVVFVLGGSDAVEPGQTPTGLGSVHFHGTMDVIIDGEQLDFAHDDRFIEQDPHFHFHGGNHVWHVHSRGVTLEYALATLGIDVDEGGNILRFDGETYDDTDDDTTISITVDGEPVEPTRYELDGVGPVSDAADGAGDSVLIVVERE